MKHLDNSNKKDKGDIKRISNNHLYIFINILINIYVYIYSFVFYFNCHPLILIQQSTILPISTRPTPTQ